MGKKVNLYLDDETLNIWNSIPQGQRSNILKRALRDYNKGEMTPKQEIIMKLKEKLHKINSTVTQLSFEREMIEKELKQLDAKTVKIDIDSELFFNTILNRAKLMCENRANYRSFTGKSYYKIHNTTSEKIYIHNIRTGRTNSNFSRKTTDKAVERLVAAGGKLPIGEFIPVKMHEYSVVHLHPNLSVMNDFIVWNTQKISYVTEEMLPVNQDLAAYPPEDWVSNDNWLAVTIDGYKAHICIYTSTTHWGSDKIVIEFMEQHPHFTSDSNFDAQPFMTKYFSILGLGILHWGHHYVKDGVTSGSTQTVLTVDK